MGVDGGLDGERPVRASEPRIAPRGVLGPAEVRQQILEAPTGGPISCPAVVAGAIATQVRHRVDATGTAQYPSSRIAQDGAIEPGLWHCVKAPVDVAAEKREPLCGHAHCVGAVVTARFDEQNPGSGILAETRCHNTTRGPAADDDVVE